MRRSIIFFGLLASVGFLVAQAATSTVVARTGGEYGKPEVVLRDDCDPTDPGWAHTGGCNREEGAVRLAEFNALRLSTLAPSVIGHQAWWFDPSYLQVETGQRIKIRNDGGRTHTFTEVANFGGGRVGPLNTSQTGIPPLTQAPECLASTVVDIPGGGKDVVDGLAPGNHKFQCCIHPWMRTLVKVHPEN